MEDMNVLCIRNNLYETTGASMRQESIMTSIELHT